jgi:beta-lactamase regulating signal transducer with metallopeptidase domain
MLAWMLYAVMVSLLLSIGAFAAERALRLTRGRTRWIWITAIAASLALPTVIASVTVQLPSVMSPAVAEKVVVLREVTTQALSPVMWMSGSAAEPVGWRDFDSLLTTLWRAASGAMLLALVLSGAHLAWRKRRWRQDTVAGARVYVTEGVGPAVVGLLRPRIVVPRWVTMALPPQQAAVMAHEQSHLEARDPQLFTFALALLVFMPWNLPLWWQLRRLRCAIEVDCDARVLEGGIDPTHYGETLISVGERQSAYIGAVAAMSESKSFLEERIRIMFSKPVKWRRVGIATLAGLSLTLTALAAQVSPPNIRTAEATASQGGEAKSQGSGTKPGERVAIKLPAATLDRYVGTYKLSDQSFMTIARDGDKLMARLTGQPSFEIFPETETRFFWKIVDAQLTFALDGSGLVQSATLHQFGQDMPLSPADASEATAAQAALDARIQGQAQSPGTEAALRREIAAEASGRVLYEEMEQMLASAARQQEMGILAQARMRGELKSLTFKGVGNQGWDNYEAQFENAKIVYSIILAPNGKIAGMLSFAAP